MLESCSSTIARVRDRCGWVGRCEIRKQKWIYDLIQPWVPVRAESAWARLMLDFGWIGGLGENLDLVLAREASEREEVERATCVFCKSVDKADINTDDDIGCRTAQELYPAKSWTVHYVDCRLSLTSSLSRLVVRTESRRGNGEKANWRRKDESDGIREELSNQILTELIERRKRKGGIKTRGNRGMECYVVPKNQGLLMAGGTGDLGREIPDTRLVLDGPRVPRRLRKYLWPAALPPTPAHPHNSPKARTPPTQIYRLTTPPDSIPAPAPAYHPHLHAHAYLPHPQQQQYAPQYGTYPGGPAPSSIWAPSLCPLYQPGVPAPAPDRPTDAQGLTPAQAYQTQSGPPALSLAIGGGEGLGLNFEFESSTAGVTGNGNSNEDGDNVAATPDLSQRSRLGVADLDRVESSRFINSSRLESTSSRSQPSCTVRQKNAIGDKLGT
ncbi:hypothetical protein B0H13DRAFT_1876984 [Mycena leptocephala]|nr:hypothetical protein B0H13DRAFT_1876984 [Mycena leptocephala]